MNRYLIFSGADYESQGGAHDVVGSRDLLRNAKKLALEHWDPQLVPAEPDVWVPIPRDGLHLLSSTSLMNLTVRTAFGYTTTLDYDDVMEHTEYIEQLHKGHGAYVHTDGWAHVLDLRSGSIHTPTYTLLAADEYHYSIHIEWTEQPCR